MERLTLDVSGMSCGHCVGRVTNALNAMNGVKVEDVQIGTATVSFDPAVTSADRIAAVIDDAGYSARPAGRAA